MDDLLNLHTPDDLERGELPAPEPVGPDDTETSAKIDWTAAGIKPPKLGSCGECR
jgi:hypothetical protein